MLLVATCGVLLTACSEPPEDVQPVSTKASATIPGPLASESAAPGSAVPEPPSVDLASLKSASLVIVTLDTTRPDHLTPYAGDGGKLDDGTFETPVMQGLANEGIVFDSAWATTPVTLPSHGSLFTGHNPPRHGLRNNGIHYLSSDAVTLAEVLAEQGFRTGAFVSAAVLDRRYGLDQGFEVYDDDFSQGGPKQQRLNAERPAARTVEVAQAWLDTLPRGSRFFLWVHLFDPHAPYDPPSPWRERFAQRPYDGEIAAVDAAIGTLFAHPRLAQRSETVAVVVGDHGESLGEHGEATHAMLAYDATLRIPWLMRLPIGGDGRRVSEPVSQVDLYPTLVEWLVPSVEGGPEVDGLSLQPLLSGASTADWQDRVLYAETLVPFYTYGWSPLRTLRRGGMKFIDAPRRELYDLNADPEELHNLWPADASAEEFPWQDELARFDDETHASEASSSVDSEMAAKLRSLGYLGTRVAPTASRSGPRPDPKDLIALHGDLEVAQHQLLQGEFEAAIERLRRALRRDPENLVALATLSKAWVATERPEKALELVDKALTLDPSNPDLLVTAGRIELSQGRLDAALALFESALDIDARWLDASIERLRMLFLLERETAGRQALDALLADEPDFTRAQVAFAELVELPAREFESAIARLVKITGREPYLSEAWRLLGRVREAAGQTDEAISAYSEGLEFLPRDSALQARLGVLLARRGRVDEAEPYLRFARSEGQGSSPEVHHALATVARHRGQWNEVELAARQAVSVAPDYSPGWNLLAAALEEQGRFAEALEFYGMAAAKDASNWQARFNQASLLSRLQRYSEARELYEAVLQQQPDHGASHFQLGVLLAGAFDEPALARHHLEASLRVESNPQQAEQIRRLLAQLP